MRLKLHLRRRSNRKRASRSERARCSSPSTRYVLIILLSAAYIHFNLGFEVLFSLNNESYQPLTSFEFNVVVFVMIIGIGASIACCFCSAWLPVARTLTLPRHLGLSGTDDADP